MNIKEDHIEIDGLIFEIPSFECELLDMKHGKIIGWADKGAMQWLPSGKVLDGYSDRYNLIPIQQHWYENPNNFPALIKSVTGGCVWVHYFDGTSVYDYRSLEYNIIESNWELADISDLYEIYVKGR